MDQHSRDEIRSAAEKAWASSPSLRHEFGDNKAAFLAYRVALAEGRIRVYGSPSNAEARASSDPRLK